MTSKEGFRNIPSRSPQ